MKKGYLSDYFEGIVAKRLSPVEADRNRSNQHEFNGIKGFKTLFGETKMTLDAHFIYMGDDEEKNCSDKGFLTWYDAREKHATRSEYRFYFPSTEVSRKAKAEDLLIVGKKSDGKILIIIAEAGSTTENQLLWLFDIDQSRISTGFTIKTSDDTKKKSIDFVSKLILSQLAIETEERDENYLEILLDEFPKGFPDTKTFSAFARKSLTDIYSEDDPDQVLCMWMEYEEMLFKTLEQHFVNIQLDAGFGDVDDLFPILSVFITGENPRSAMPSNTISRRFSPIIN